MELEHLNPVEWICSPAGEEGQAVTDSKRQSLGALPVLNQLQLGQKRRIKGLIPVPARTCPLVAALGLESLPPWGISPGTLGVRGSGSHPRPQR